VDVDLEVEVAAEAASVAAFADRADPLPLPHPLALADTRRPRHVGVEVAAGLPFPVNQQVVAIEDRVVALLQDPAVTDRDQLGAAGGGDVEAFVDAAAAARRVVGADRPAYAVWTLDREDVAVVRDAPVAALDCSRNRRGSGCEKRC
jgi:hypothetical protein